MQLSDAAWISVRNGDGVERVHNLARDGALVAKRFGQATAGCDRPAKIDLLRADATDQSGKQVHLTDLADARKLRVVAGNDRILSAQASEILVGQNEGARDRSPGELDMFRRVDRDVKPGSG
ncbi:MAG: hypothetical protein NVSMB2_03460 [Chloroflexota bacterium]